MFYRLATWFGHMDSQSIAACRTQCHQVALVHHGPMVVQTVVPCFPAVADCCVGQGFEAAAAKSHYLSAQYFVRSPGHCCSLWDVTDWRIILRDTDGDKLLCFFWLCHVLTSWWWMDALQRDYIIKITVLSPFSSFSRILGFKSVEAGACRLPSFDFLVCVCVWVCACAFVCWK